MIRKHAERVRAILAEGHRLFHLIGPEAEEVAEALGMRHVPLRSATAEEIEARASALPVAFTSPARHIFALYRLPPMMRMAAQEVDFTEPDRRFFAVEADIVLPGRDPYGYRLGVARLVRESGGVPESYGAVGGALLRAAFPTEEAAREFLARKDLVRWGETRTNPCTGEARTEEFTALLPAWVKRF